MSRLRHRSGLSQTFPCVPSLSLDPVFHQCPPHFPTPGPPTPPNYFPPLPTLLPLTTYTLSLLHPASPRPALPKTESLLAPRYAELISSFADMRGEWMRKSLGVLLGRVEEVDEGGIWEMGRGREKAGGLVALWEGMIVLTEVSGVRRGLGGGKGSPVRGLTGRRGQGV